MRKTNELKSWLALTDHGIELPDELVDLAANVDRLKAERDALPVPQKARTAPSQMAAGVATIDAVTAATEDERREAEADQARRVAAQAIKAAERRIRIYLQSHRDELIEHTARPAVDAILSDATKVADDLSGIGLDATAEQIAMHATPAEVKAWRKAQTLNVRLDAILTAWHATWLTASVRVGQEPGAIKADEFFRPGAPGGVHVWTDPWAVEDEQVRDGVNRDALAIARWAEVGGYRPATIAELADLTLQWQSDDYIPTRGTTRVFVPVA